jgi:hypothetical protein
VPDSGFARCWAALPGSVPCLPPDAATNTGFCRSRGGNSDAGPGLTWVGEGGSAKCRHCASHLRPSQQAEAVGLRHASRQANSRTSSAARPLVSANDGPPAKQSTLPPTTAATWQRANAPRGGSPRTTGEDHTAQSPARGMQCFVRFPRFPLQFTEMLFHFKFCWISPPIHWNVAFCCIFRSPAPQQLNPTSNAKAEHTFKEA